MWYIYLLVEYMHFFIYISWSSGGVQTDIIGKILQRVE